MANLQVRNIPEELHERLREHAKKNRSSMSNIVLDAIERELKRLEFHDKLGQLPKTTMSVDAATLLAEARAERDAELESRNHFG